ncbi:MAG: hypothetical protein WEE64_08990 [Dehalococcoidia bacterium]
MPNTFPTQTPNQEVAFVCAVCKGALAGSDLGEFGLRTPDFGETADQYCDRELLDPRELRHLACLMRESQRAS